MLCAARPPDRANDAAEFQGTARISTREPDGRPDGSAANSLQSSIFFESAGRDESAPQRVGHYHVRILRNSHPTHRIAKRCAAAWAARVLLALHPPDGLAVRGDVR